MNKRRREVLTRWVGYAVSATCVGVLAIKVDWHAFAEHFRTLDPRPIAIAVLIQALTYLMFALRWRLLLVFDPKPSLRQVASFLMLGYLGNLLLPMRAGDAARVVMIRNACGHGSARALSSIVLERLLDMLAVLAVGVGVSLAADLPETILLALRSAAAIVGFAVLLLAWVSMRPASAIRVVNKALRPVGERVSQAADYHVKQFAEALAIIRPSDRSSMIRVTSIAALTGLGWLCAGIAMVMCTAAFGVEPPIPAGLLILVLTNLGSAIPSSPASLGVYHTLAVLALSSWHVGLDLSLSVATVSHAVVVGVQLVLGLAAMISVTGGRDLLKAVNSEKADS